MFRLIKLGWYVMLGYFAYEMYLGITAERGAKGPAALKGRASKGGGSNMTGKGRGKKVRTEDADGASESHVVGRGVV
jgi:hypothetical protein